MIRLDHAAFYNPAAESSKQMPNMPDLLKEGRVTDPFFQVLQDGDWNACIGKQSDSLNYVEGYLQAAQLLVDTLIQQKLYAQRDTLVMPILYNARHGLNLLLKYVLGELVMLNLAQPRQGVNNHDLMVYWSHLDAQSIGDQTTSRLVADLKPYVVSLANIDDDGQELRYFTNQEGEQSLAEHAVANLILIKIGVEALRNICGQIINRLFGLSRECMTGTYTDRCSRKDLAEIAQLVGSRSSWSNEDFDTRKSLVCANYGLSNRAFSKALKTIEKSRELKVLIELETPLIHLTQI